MPSIQIWLFFSAILAASATLTPKQLTKIIPSLSAFKAQSLLNDPSIKFVELQTRRSTYKDLLKRTQRTRANANVQPGFYFDFMLSLDFALGDNDTTYDLSLETGVNKVFVFDKSFDGERDRERPTWDPEASKTAIPKKEPFSVMTAGCLATGKTYVEELRIFGDNFPFNQTIGSVNKLNFTYDDDGYPFDGVIGFGWDPSLSQQTPGENAPPIVNLFSTIGGGSAYTFIIGESSSTIAFNYTLKGFVVPLVNANGVPAVAVSSVKYGNYETHSEFFGIIDTGYNTIALPPELYRQVVKTVKPEFDPEVGVFTVDCGDNTIRPPRILFEIEDVEFDVRQIHYVVDKDFPEEKCVLAVSQSLTPNTIQLGMPFIRTVALSFDFKKNQAVILPIGMLGIDDDE